MKLPYLVARPLFAAAPLQGLPAGAAAGSLRRQRLHTPAASRLRVCGSADSGLRVCGIYGCYLCISNSAGSRLLVCGINGRYLCISSLRSCRVTDKLLRICANHLCIGSISASRLRISNVPAGRDRSVR